ncbi:MAG: PhnD/SsuA/transferrin family substrate-binding protein [Actinobacteria bacterium]|nr:PhnD/SsuA/transferrin family substrate-binding protein [Actinomycetota bacterium]
MVISQPSGARVSSTKTRMTSLRIWSLLTILMLVLAACGGDEGTAVEEPEDAAATEAEAEPEATEAEAPDDGTETEAAAGGTDTTELSTISLRLLELAGVPEAMISYWTMVEPLGYFDEYALDVEILTSAGGGPPKIQALLAGEADVVISDVVSVASAMNQGAEIKAVAGASSHYGATIVGRADYESLEDLRGQNFGVPSLGGTARIITDVTLRENDLLGEVNYLAVGGSPEMVPALEAGRIAAGTFTPSVLPLMREDPDLNVLVENTATIHERLPNFVYVTTDAFIEENPDAIQRLVKAMIEGERDIAENFESYQTAVESMMPGTYTDEQLEDLWTTITEGGYWAVNGGIHFEALTGVLDLFYELPDSPTDPTITEGSQLYDTQFVDAGLEDLGMVESEFDEPDWR